jgi:hypothetical protein
MATLESLPEWVKSSLSFANGNCVEVAGLSGGEVGVRNQQSSTLRPREPGQRPLDLQERTRARRLS